MWPFWLCLSMSQLLMMCCGERETGIFMYSYCFMSVPRYTLEMSKPENVAPSVLRMLFHSIFDVVRLAILVVRSPGVLIRLPQAVIQTLLGSSLCGLKSITICAYITTLSSGMQSFSSWVTMNIAFSLRLLSSCLLGPFFQIPCILLTITLPLLLDYL